MADVVQRKKADDQEATPSTGDGAAAASAGRIVQLKAAQSGQSYDDQANMMAPDRASGGLPGDVRGKMENAFGADFSNVGVHVDGKAEEHGAKALASGDNIHVAAAEYNPHSRQGQELIGHEFAHVVQQRGGLGAATMGKGGILTDHTLEAEADRAGEQAARGERVSMASTAAGEVSGAGAVQYNKTPAQWLAELASEFSALQTAAAHQTPPPWDGQSPTVGSESENYKPRPCKPEDVVDMWKAFLGPGPYSNVHPRTGAADSFRLVSGDGTKSIRYGNHERKASTKHHYHEETWTYDSGANTVAVDNQVQRCPLK